MLKQLFQLQSLESEERYWQDKQKNSQLMRRLKELKTGYDQQSAIYLRLQKQSKTVQEQLQQAQEQSQELAARLEQEEKELYGGTVSSPKSISAKEQQIKGLDGKVTALEEEIQHLHEELRCRQLELAHIHEVLSQAAADFAELKEKYQAQKAVYEEKQAALGEKKRHLLQEIEEGWQDWYYKRIWDYAGFPVARLGGSSACSRCHTIIPANQSRKIMLQKVSAPGEIIFCENCGRALFYEED